MKLKYIPDSRIIELATHSGKLGQLTTYRDINMSGGFNINNLRPVPGGVYDRSIFGPMKVGKLPTVDSMRFGCIKLPIPICLDVRKDKLVQFMKKLNIFLCEVYEKGVYLQNSPLFKEYKGNKIKDALDYLQFNVLDNKIVATPNITDSTKCSYEGIVLALKELGRLDDADMVKSFLNNYILVLPIGMRKFSVVMVGGELVPNNDPLTQAYRYLLYGIEKYHESLANPEFSDETEEANAKLALLNYKLRRLACSISQSNPLLKGSHDNFSRKMQRNRISGSARAAIVPGSELQIDEVGIPLHLAYEMMDKEFIEYLMENFNISKAVARAKYAKPYEGNTLEIFSHYIDGTKPKKSEDGSVPEDFKSIEWIKDEKGPKYVIINRQPTLHQLSMLSCRVKLTKDNSIRYPILLCSPLNADFDGDTISVLAVPKYYSDTVNRSMSPKNLIYWTKNNAPLFTPSHEMMLGLIVMSKQATEDEVVSYNSVEDAKKALMLEFRKKASERKLKFNTRLSIDDNVNTTTIGRAILSMMFDNDPLFVENALDDTSKPRVQLDADLVAKFIINLAKFMDGQDYEGASREERIKDIQYWSMMASTKSGSTAPSLSQLYLGVSKDMLERIKEIEDDSLLDQTTKSVRIANIYEEYVDRKQARGLSDEVIRQVRESSRAKESQLVEMTSPQLVVDPDGDTHVTSTTYVQGMGFEDYVNMVVSGRGIQDIKHASTPTSGYLTRQLVYACYNWHLNAAEVDITNTGLLLPGKLAVGRTLLDGTIYKGGDDNYVRVRSLITSTKPRFVVTPDMLNAKYHNYHDNYAIGTSFSTSLTEGITQSALGLKHGGTLQDFDKDTYLIAPEDCSLSIDDNYITLTSRTKVYKYPKPTEFSLLSINSQFKKGDKIGLIPEQFTPGLKCDATIKFLGATGSRTSKEYLRNKLVISDCYACNEGVIRFTTKKVSHQGKTYEAIVVKIGDVEYAYNPRSMYHYADGDVVPLGARICSGIGSMSFILNHIKKTNDISLAYQLFYDQVNRLVPGITTELLEFIFSVVFTDVDDKTGEHKLVFRSISEVLKKDGGTYQRHARQSPKTMIADIDPIQGEEFVIDDMSNLFLTSLINKFS